MKLSTRGQYATRAMLQLALNCGGKPLSIREIAVLEGISEQYLEQIFRDLRKTGLVESVRGAHGGYLLRHAIDNISVGDIIRAVEGPIAPVSCLSSDEACGRSSQCVTRKVWAKLHNSMLNVLNETSLANMVEMANEKEC
jgi:Rrf2 family transcriptional regulator, cysteine metabolism repressor